jgi:hypothetical protein
VRSIVAVLCLAISLPILASPSAQEIEARIARDGAPNTLHAIFSDSALEDHVYRSIARGSEPWLRVATALRLVSDGAATTMLNGAVGEALPNAPYRVLPLLVNGPFSPEQSCLPFLSEDMSPYLALNHIQLMEVTLRQVSSPKYTQVRATCLRIAREARQAIKRSLTSRSTRTVSGGHPSAPACTAG